MTTGKVLVGILAGAAAGAALGLLFAPEKGSVTRGKISSKGEDLWSNLRDRFEDLISSATEEIDEAKKDAENLYAKGKEKVQETKQDLKSSANLH